MDKGFFKKTRILDAGMGQELLNRGLKPKIIGFQTIVFLQVKIHLYKPWVWNQLNTELKV